MRGIIIFYCWTIFFVPLVQGQTMSWRDIMAKLSKSRPKADKIIPYGPDSLQFGELWLPASPGPYPVVLLVHGGCWRADLPGTELLVYAAQALKEEGYAVWSVEYRRVGHAGGGYPGTFLDLAMAADHLTKLAGEHRLDLSRVVASGHSAGGHLALWLALRSNLPSTSGLYVKAPLQIKAVVSLAGIGDLKYFDRAGAPACGEETIDLLINRAVRQETGFTDTSPVEMGLAPMTFWLINGVYDAAVPPHVALNYLEKIKPQGQAAELVLIQNAGHFEIIVPWTKAWPQVLATFKKAFKSK